MVSTTGFNNGFQDLGDKGFSNQTANIQFFRKGGIRLGLQQGYINIILL